jgi:glycosyl transferase, family 25
MVLPRAKPSRKMVVMNGLHTWVINLDRAPDRLARITEQMQRLQLPFTRLAAVDARAMTAQDQARLDTPNYCRQHGMTPLLGELGCYLSHVRLMQQFLRSQAEFALVLEDDVMLHASLPAVLHGLMAQAARWDMVKLSGVHSGTPVRVSNIAPGHDLAVMLSRCTGSSAYLINRRAAQAYVAGLLPMSLPYDHVFDQGWRFKLKVRIVTPRPCGHDDQIASTILAPVGSTRKFHWTKRLPAFAYRLGNEWARLRYGLRSWIQEFASRGRP